MIAAVLSFFFITHTRVDYIFKSSETFHAVFQTFRAQNPVWENDYGTIPENNLFGTT